MHQPEIDGHHFESASESPIRDRLINQIVIIWAASAVILLMLSYLRAAEIGWATRDILYSLIGATIVLLALIRHRVRAQNKAIILLSRGLVAGIIGVYSFVMMAAVIFFFPLSTVMLALFSPPKVVALFGTFSVLFLCGVALKFSSPSTSAATDVAALHHNPAPWGITIFCFAFLILITCLTMINDRKENRKLIRRITSQRDQLEKSNADLKRTRAGLIELQGILPICCSGKKSEMIGASGNKRSGIFARIPAWISCPVSAPLVRPITPLISSNRPKLDSFRLPFLILLITAPMAGSFPLLFMLRSLRRLLKFYALFSVCCLPLAFAQSSSVEAENGMVVSTHHLASQVGVEIMQQGGNAIDAAVATGFALAVVSPQNGNLGGGGFMMIHTAAGDTVALDFREVAPLAATADMYLDADQNVATGRSTLGYLANGVPGTVAGLEHAWREYGSGAVAWAEVLEPARRLAADGFTLSTALVNLLNSKREDLATNATSARIFLNNGNLFESGDHFIQPELAATLTRLQRDGARDFYEGETARLIVADQTRGGGLITLKDLSAYEIIERTPVRALYRGFEFFTMPPPSSGGIALAQMLGMLEPYDLQTIGLNSTAYIHLVTEVMRRAFRDRAEYLGDPDFFPVPQTELIQPAYIQRLMANFDPTRTTSSDNLPPGLILPAESSETTHFSAADSDGNVASCTYTLNGNFGNCMTVAGAGFLMNNEMDDFTAKIGVKNMFGLIQGEANAIVPRKRPLSSMTPTIVLRAGKPFLATGAPGGPTIITTVLQVLLNVIDHQLPLNLATDAPRFHHQWQPDDIKSEPFLASIDTLAALEAKGHVFALRRLYAEQSAAAARYWGDAESIQIDPETGLLTGVSDKRSPNSAPAGF